MHRFYIPDLPDRPTTIILPASEAVHATRVLRVQPHDELTVLNGRGLRVLARVNHADRNRVDLKVLHIEQENAPGIQITLFQALTKPASMDWLVEKATELGVSRIQPVVTERTVSRLDALGASKKTEKWKRTAVEALKQCGGAWAPRIDAPNDLARLLEESKGFDCQLLASLSAGATPLRHQIAPLNADIGSSQTVQIGIWIGPEGDFTSNETELILATGALPFTLGPNVLRSETAAVCAISLVLYEMNLLHKSLPKPS